MLITDAEINGERRDVRISGDTITEIGVGLERHVEDQAYDAAGGALLPGLHDHHLHLHAMASALSSIACGPPDVSGLDDLATALRGAPGSGWIRGVGYHESVAGVLDRAALDRLVADRPVRVQHRGGGLWMLNTKALETLGIQVGPAEIEVGDDGTASGRLWRADAQMRVAGSGPPDLAPVGRRLLGYGITGVTDATPDLDKTGACHLVQQVASGVLPQRVLALGLESSASPRVGVGPLKILLHDHDLPGLEELKDRIADAHAGGRAVAVHCVTRHAFVLTIAALDLAGYHSGDRIEHGAVVPSELRPMLAAHQVAVVTQPSFIRDRGDTYRRDVDPGDLDELYPYGSLCDAGIPVAPSSDAPFGDLDPWRAMQTAAERRTSSGAELGVHERVTPRDVLDGYLSPLTEPGGPPRTIRVGAAADLCLLSEPLAAALANPSKDNIRLTLIDGQVHDDT